MIENPDHNVAKPGQWHGLFHEQNKELFIFKHDEDRNIGKSTALVMLTHKRIAAQSKKIFPKLFQVMMFTKISFGFVMNSIKDLEIESGHSKLEVMVFMLNGHIMINLSLVQLFEIYLRWKLIWMDSIQMREASKTIASCWLITYTDMQ